MDLRDFPGLQPSPAMDWPAQRWVPEFLFVEGEIPCSDRLVPIARDVVRYRKRRARSLEVEERRRRLEAEKAERARTREARKAARKLELDALKVRCPGCKRLVYPDRPCGTCARLGRERFEREQRSYARLPVTGVIVVLADKREVTLSADDYSFYSREAYMRGIDERHWIALRLGLIAAA